MPPNRSPPPKPPPPNRSPARNPDPRPAFAVSFRPPRKSCSKARLEGNPNATKFGEAKLNLWDPTITPVVVAVAVTTVAITPVVVAVAVTITITIALTINVSIPVSPWSTASLSDTSAGAVKNRSGSLTSLVTVFPTLTVALFLPLFLLVSAGTRVYTVTLRA